MKRILCGLLAGAVLSGAALAQSGPYQQSPAVLARYPDVPVALEAPGLAPGRTRFTTHEEMLAHLDRVKARAPWVVRATLGRSQQDREIPSLVFTREGLADPAAIRALGRPIVWLIGQQHGNEPAGGEAMLPLAAALADGELKPLLDRVTVVIVPRANPDGAEAFTRTTANGLDANRDHLLLTLPEVRAIHAKMAELPPDIVVDAHEYQVAGTWLAKFGGLQKADAMLLYATHPAVPKEVAGLAETAYIPAIEAAFRPHGLTWFWYHTATSANPQDRTVSLGGNAPGISRNNFGLNGAVSFLVETRGIGVGLQGFRAPGRHPLPRREGGAGKGRRRPGHPAPHRRRGAPGDRGHPGPARRRIPGRDGADHDPADRPADRRRPADRGRLHRHPPGRGNRDPPAAGRLPRPAGGPRRRRGADDPRPRGLPGPGAAPRGRGLPGPPAGRPGQPREHQSRPGRRGLDRAAGRDAEPGRGVRADAPARRRDRGRRPRAGRAGQPCGRRARARRALRRGARLPGAGRGSPAPCG